MDNQSELHPCPSCPLPVGFDIDGVVADTAGAFLRIAAEDYGATHLRLEDIRQFDLEGTIDLPPRLVREIFHRLMVDPLGEDLQPMPGAVEVLEDLARHADLIFVTARPLHQPIGAWLDAHLSTGARRRLHLTATGEHDNKAPFLHKLGVRTFIDDRAETCTALAAAGFHAIVYHQPWNHGRHHLPTVPDWQAIGGILLDKRNQTVYDQRPLPHLRPLPATPSHR